MKTLIVSDIHGNWPALEAVLQAEPQQDQVVFLGDVVDYGPFPVGCLHWVVEHANHLVRGNHDNALGFDLDCRCMRTSRECSLATRAWHRRVLSEAHRDLLRNMPTLDWFEWDGHHFRLAHATPQGDIFEYLPMEQWGQRVKDIDADFVLLGHTHLQGMRTFGKTTVINPGSVGLARDGGGEACYAVLDDGQVHLKRVPYDVERTIDALAKAPLPAQVIEKLCAVMRTGKIPS